MILAPLLLALLQADARPAPSAPVRPRDPFVFRCVLDGRARMLVAALDEEMWAAWDTATCGLVKAWKGGVNFDGAVYTTVHGPQPTSKGVEYTSGAEGSPWSVLVDGYPVTSRSSWVGYTSEHGRLVLEWKISFGTKRELIVRERPECVRAATLFSKQQLADAGLGDGATPALRRDFEVAGIADGEQLNLALRLDGAVLEFANRLERERTEEVKDEAGVVTSKRMWAQLPLTSSTPFNSITLAFRPVVLPPPKEEKK